MAEWSNAAVLKTVEGHTSGGSNPLSPQNPDFFSGFFYRSVKILEPMSIKYFSPFSIASLNESAISKMV